MQLLIDAGNTAIKYRFVLDQQLIVCSLNEIKQNLEQLTKVVYASVSDHQELADLLTLCTRYQIEVLRVESEPVKFGVTCGYKNCSNLGVDRWLAVLGAVEQFPTQNLIVVDAGTAMTIDFVAIPAEQASEKHHLGGWILPGLALQKTSIINKAPGVFDDFSGLEETIGTDTPSALHNGCLQGLLGAISQADNWFRETHNCSPQLVITGGDAKEIVENMTQPTTLNQDLVFLGLKRFL